jgi:hypothetical protein
MSEEGYLGGRTFTNSQQNNPMPKGRIMSGQSQDVDIFSIHGDIDSQPTVAFNRLSVKCLNMKTREFCRMKTILS